MDVDELLAVILIIHDTRLFSVIGERQLKSLTPPMRDHTRIRLQLQRVLHLEMLVDVSKVLWTPLGFARHLHEGHLLFGRLRQLTEVVDGQLEVSALQPRVRYLMRHIVETETHVVILVVASILLLGCHVLSVHGREGSAPLQSLIELLRVLTADAELLRANTLLVNLSLPKGRLFAISHIDPRAFPVTLVELLIVDGLALIDMLLYRCEPAKSHVPADFNSVTDRPAA